MKKYVGLALLAASVVAPQAASAQQELCSPNATDHVCVTAKFVLSGSNTINVFVFNGSSGEGVNWQSVLTQFAIGGVPSVGSWSLAADYFNDYNGTTLVSDGSVALASNGGWGAPTPAFSDLGFTITTGAAGPGGSGGISTCDGPASTVNNPVWRTCEGDGSGFGATDDWFKFSFLYSAGGLNQSTLDNLSWGFKVQSVEGLAGQSFECNSTVTDPAADKYCTLQTGGVPEETPVPEPATMSLMAFGLVGIAAAAKRRRSR